MAAVTSDWNLRPLVEFTHQFILDTSAAQTGYKGEPLICDVSEDTDHVAYVHDVTHPVVATGDTFVGIAMEGKTVTIGSAETLQNGGVWAWTDGSIIGFPSVGTFDHNDHVGETVYYCSGALNATAGDTPIIGTVEFIEDGYVYVKIVAGKNAGA